ncbi:MAG: hypothetical protein K8R99_11050 [Actinomycetia bacterium]|nr:hypothetical protein [Actinomycetes bacterium]
MTNREQLLAVKLAALVREHDPASTDLQPGEFGAGAALMAGSSAWVLLDDRPERGLGAALAWALRHDAKQVNILAEQGAGVLARRAIGWTPPVHVWQIADRVLRSATPEPLVPSPPLPSAHAELEALIRDSGAEPIVEHGVLRGEVDGLEVCRVVNDPHTDGVRLEVGVGAHDREAFLLLHGDRPTGEALADVVRSVREHRSPGAARHPLNLLAQERALRAQLVADPALISASHVRPVAPPIPRANVKDAVPCVAQATIASHQVTVVCSTGVDLDVVPFAVDAMAACGTNECLIVLPARDALEIQQRIAAAAPGSIAITPLARP